MKLKVCGLGNLSEIENLIDLKIDFLGFIFYPKSKRYVLNYLDIKDLKKNNFENKVGVFVNETSEKIIEISEEAGLNWVQLHGDETLEEITQLKKNSLLKIIKVFRISEQSCSLQEKLNLFENTVDAFLFDTDSENYGGTGKPFDWEILNQIKTEKMIFLSGGLSLENQNNLTNLKIQIHALDINSHFEDAPARKNIEKIKLYKHNLLTL